jgi:hypothetical protein
MKGKVLFVVGLGAGYVLGTRAGRQRYEQIKSAWLKVWGSPAVQKQVHTVQDFTADRIGDLGDVVTANLKRAVTKTKVTAKSAASKVSHDDDESAAGTGSGTVRASRETKSGKAGGSGSGGQAS